MNIYMMNASKDALVYNYGQLNLIFLCLFLVPPLVVGYRLNYILQTYENNNHCFYSYFTLIVYLHQNDELKIFRHIIFITPYIQIACGGYVSNFIVYENELFNFFKIFYIIFTIFISLVMIQHIYMFMTKYHQYVSIQNQYQHYIYLQDRQQCYEFVGKTARYALFVNLAYQITKMIICIIIIKYSQINLIQVASSAMVSNTVIQILGTFKLIKIEFLIQHVYGQQITQVNHLCFQNYWCLIESIVRSKKLQLYYNISLGFYFTQSAIAVAIILTGNSDLTKINFFDLQCYVVIDSIATLAFMIIKIMIELFKGFYTLEDYYQIFKFRELGPRIVYPLDIAPRIQILTEQDIRNIISQGIDCCICLERVIQPNTFKQLECDGRHVFHINCINQWLLHHPTCPLCQQVVHNF